MSDISVFCLNYRSGALLQQALSSISTLKPRIKTLYLINSSTAVDQQTFPYETKTIAVSNREIAGTLNNLLPICDSTYTLFLHNGDTLLPNALPNRFTLPPDKTVMTFKQAIGSQYVEQPFFVRTALFQEKQFADIVHLPFPEALFPAWLQNVETRQIVHTEDPCIKRPRANTSKSEREKYALMMKYSRTKAEIASPSLAIIMSAFNMTDYLETAIASCFLQQTQPDQLLMIDDGSKDDSYEKMRKWEKQRGVKAFKQKNRGKARALNALLPHVETDFVMELDADDWLDPDALFTIKKKLQRLPKQAAVLYGNFRRWKQQPTGTLLYKTVAKGKPVRTASELLSYPFPLGPRIYRTAMLKQINGFPVTPFENGRLYEDVSVLVKLIKQPDSVFCYEDFTVYNIREHPTSITRLNRHKWNAFLPHADGD
ncbi:glycosyltransferase family A protein [Shouchella tritolerans]|uniref:glycosyltransferase family A protein n=1 Tax=Shouchella tritolerans TaxID=2979466 RepID=UPI0021E8DC3A|nr:glycosyltransferase family A protein [Shouchella tritolerans]